MNYVFLSVSNSANLRPKTTESTNGKTESKLGKNMETIKINEPAMLKDPIQVPTKILMGPGPSNASERVLKAIGNPLMGHLHPETLKIMDEIKAGLRYAFQTNNEATMCISASGTAGMEMTFSNLLEFGDVLLVGTTGHWGLRAKDIAERKGIQVYEVKASLGCALSLTDIKMSLEKFKPKLFFVVQGESSTGVLQRNLKEIGELCRSQDCLFAVDTVASLGGTEFLMDEWLIDVAYTGSQKVLGAPPGITPISFNERAIKHIQSRKTKCESYYFDALLIAQCWGCYNWQRIYHLTVSTTLLYGLREALALLAEDTITHNIERHQKCAARLQAGLKNLALELFVQDPIDRLPTVNAIKIPEHLDWMRVSEYAMKNYSLEISGGLGPTANKILRIGVMGVNATEAKVDFFLKVLNEALSRMRTETRKFS